MINTKDNWNYFQSNFGRFNFEDLSANLEQIMALRGRGPQETHILVDIIQVDGNPVILYIMPNAYLQLIAVPKISSSSEGLVNWNIL